MSEIKLFGDPVLHSKTMPITGFEGVLELEARLLKAMNEAGGIGIAANQIGVPLSMCIIMLERGGTLTMLNPEVTFVDPNTTVFPHDGCLSVPGVSGPTERHDSITIKYQDVSSDFHMAAFEGLEAVIVQHELDHLNGKLYLDRLGKLKRGMLLKKYLKLSKS